MGRLTFKRAGWQNDGRPVYDVFNKDGFQTGSIYWEKKWGCWVYDQHEEAIDSRGCLKEVTDYIGFLTYQDRRKPKQGDTESIRRD